MAQGGDYFSAAADEYARHRPTYPDALLAFLQTLAPSPALAWDAGCGSGQLTARLAEVFEAVVGTDVSAGQLARAAPHPRVTYRTAPAERSGLPDGRGETGVTLAVAAQAAHWFDLPAYWAEVRRVARTGCGVALVSYATARIDPAVDAAVQGLYAGALERYWPPERRHVEAGYRSLDFPFVEVATPALEIRQWWTRGALVGYVGTWSALEVLARRRGEGARAAALAEFGARLARAWPDGEERREVRWPLAVRAGRVG